jgi:hypothetical protein
MFGSMHFNSLHAAARRLQFLSGVLVEKSWRSSHGHSQT